MKIYYVYDCDGELCPIKRGLSWPAFFFGAFWLLFKRLWIEAAVVFLISGTLFFTFPIAWKLLWLILPFIFGTFGNKYLENKWIKKGFKKRGIAKSSRIWLYAAITEDDIITE